MMDAPPAAFPGKPAPPLVWARPIQHLPPRHELEWAGLTWWGAGVQLICVIAVTLAAHTLLSLGVPELGEASRGTLARSLMVAKVGEALTAILVGIALLHWNRLTVAQLGWRLTGLWRQLRDGLTTLVLVYAGLLFSGVALLTGAAWLGLLKDENFSGEIEQRRKVAQLLPHDDLVASLLLLLPVVVHEELLFRGVLLPLFRRLLGSWWAAVVAGAVLFGLVHAAQGVLAMVMIGLCVGSILGAMYLRTRSLIAVMVAHFLFNLLQFQLIRLVFPGGA